MNAIKVWMGTAMQALACASLSSAWAFCGFYGGKADASLFNEASQPVLTRDGKRTVFK